MVQFSVPSKNKTKNKTKEEQNKTKQTKQNKKKQKQKQKQNKTKKNIIDANRNFKLLKDYLHYLAGKTTDFKMTHNQ